MKKIKNHKIYLVVGVFFISILICGCQWEHSHFDFMINEFEEIQINEYCSSSELESYKVMDVVFRPWIKESPYDVYNLGFYGYSHECTDDVELNINEIYLYTSSGEVLIYDLDYQNTIAYDKKEDGECFRANRIGSFTANIETVNNYDILYLDIEVELKSGEKIEQKELSYKIEVVEYMTVFMIT